MTDDLRKHLRAALESVVAQETDRLTLIYDGADASHVRRVQMLAPARAALQVLKEETEGVEGVRISIAEKGHMATVNLTSGISNHWLSLSTTSDNSEFELQETEIVTTEATRTREQRRCFPTAEEALHVIVEAVGKRVASHMVLQARSRLS
jgi:hypothetical protein